MNDTGLPKSEYITYFVILCLVFVTLTIQKCFFYEVFEVQELGKDSTRCMKNFM